jgi:hypothetical protein
MSGEYDGCSISAISFSAKNCHAHVTCGIVMVQDPSITPFFQSLSFAELPLPIHTR